MPSGETQGEKKLLRKEARAGGTPDVKLTHTKLENEVVNKNDKV
jgi:hypothetical protein